MQSLVIFLRFATLLNDYKIWKRPTEVFRKKEVRICSQLKKMYIDSAIMKSEKLDKETGNMVVKPVAVAKNISWQQFKSAGL